MSPLNKLMNRKNVLFILVVLFIAICFETSQQLFYIKRFNLNGSATFLELLKNQSYRWIIWALCGLPLPFIIKNDVKENTNFSIFLKYGFIITIVVFTNILIISLISFMLNSSLSLFSLSKFYNEYFLFFVFQKSPIYTLGYIAVTIILFLNYSKELLQIEFQNLEEVQKTNNKLYQKLKQSNSDKTKILNIKIGNNRKIIPVKSILLIEANDYCVNVHTLEFPCYSMRISLKSLEEKLPNHFLRVHRKSIVNVKMVKEIKLTSKPYLLLTNEVKVLISKSKLKQVKEYLENS